jgi:hypothetical protein
MEETPNGEITLLSTQAMKLLHYDNKRSATITHKYITITIICFEQLFIHLKQAMKDRIIP